MAKFEVYATIFVLAIIFTICDVVVSTIQLTIPSLIFSSTTAVIGFIGAYMGQTITVEEKYSEALSFIKKNFGLANIILSVLDVVCCVLALLTGVFLLMLVFRCTIAIRIVVYINKYKTVAYAVWSLVFLHTFKKIKVRVKKVMTKNTKLQNILAIVIAVFGISGVIVLNLPAITGAEVDWSRYVGMIQEVVAVACGLVLAGTHDDVVSEEELAEIQKAKELKAYMKQATAEYEAGQKAQEAEAEAKRQREIALIAEQMKNEEQAKQSVPKVGG